MNLPTELIIYILKIKWRVFRKEYLKNVLCMPVYETLLDPQYMRNTLDFAWFAWDDNPYLIRMYSFRDVMYQIESDGKCRICPRLDDLSNRVFSYSLH